MRLKTKEEIIGYLFSFPSIAFVVALAFIPFLFSFVLSLQNDAGQFSLLNYEWAMNNESVHYSVWITSLYAVTRALLIFLISLGLALAINGLRGEYIFTALIFLPWLMSDVMVGTIWRWLFHGTYGVINAMLYSLGAIKQPIDWLSGWPWAFWSVIVAGVWRDIPWGTIILLAGLKTVPIELYESAEVYGASLWQRFRYVSIPLIRGAITIFFITQLMWCFVSFGEVYTLTQGGPGGRTNILYYYVWQEGFRALRFGHGIVISYLVTVIVGIVALFYIKVIGIKGVYERE